MKPIWKSDVPIQRIIEWVRCRLTRERDAETAEIERLQSIIKKQMSPTEISQRLAECNELADAYAGQNTTIKELRAEIERLRVALRRVADLVDSEADEPLDDAITIARRALEPKP